MTKAELGASIKKNADAVQVIFAAADTEQGGVCKPEQIEEIKRLNKESEEWEQSFKSLDEQDKLRDGTKARLNWLNQSANPHTFSDDRAQRVIADAAKSMGDRFVESEEFKSWFKAVAPNGTILDGGKPGNSPTVQIAGSLKALLTGTTTWSPRADTSASALVQIDQRGLLDGGVYRRPLRLADMVPTSPTDGDTIEYVRVTGFTNNAAPVAEASATGGSSGVKPESGHTFEVIHDRVKTIAHWEPITRRAMSDAGQVRGLIDEDLRYGIEEELEDQIVNGSGVGENLTGVLNVSGRLLQTFSVDKLETSRTAITNLRLNGRETATGWVIHPTDWQAFDLLTDNEDRYYWQGPTVLGAEMLWGLPVIQSEAVSVGTAVLGNWRKARIWDREQTNIYVSDSHADFFIRNLLAILAERRLGFGVIKPKAFVKVNWS
jgi:HK97 family phage major capsid protein